MLRDLIRRYRAGEMDLEGFAAEAASAFVPRRALQYPETDGLEDYTFGISNATISNARYEGLLTDEEVKAVYDAVARLEARG